MYSIMQVLNNSHTKNNNVADLIKKGSEPFYRHGDVVLFRVNSIEEIGNDNVNKLVPTGRQIVQEGELTGHAHRLSANGSAQTEIFANMEKPGEEYIAVIGQDGASLTHEEHDRLDLEEGLYKKVIQREYDPTTKMTRQVYD